LKHFKRVNIDFKHAIKTPFTHFKTTSTFLGVKAVEAEFIEEKDFEDRIPL